MTASPAWKVHDSHGKYVASCKELEAAAALVAFYDNGATINHQHGPALWREGAEALPAHESYDNVADVCTVRLRNGLRAPMPEKES